MPARPPPTPAGLTEPASRNTPPGVATAQYLGADAELNWSQGGAWSKHLNPDARRTSSGGVHKLSVGRGAHLASIRAITNAAGALGAG